jgi:hypothetical protein
LFFHTHFVPIGLQFGGGSTNSLLMVLTTKFRPSKPRVREEYTTSLLTVYIRIKLHMDLQADKSPVVFKGPFFPRVVNPRYRIRGTML